MAARLLAMQLGRPSKLAGRLILAPLWNRRNVALNDAALARLALKSDDCVLEVGFGGGYLLSRIAEAVTAGAVAGVDASEAMVAYSKHHLQSLVDLGRLDVCCALAEALPYPTGRFDKVCSVNSLFYWSDAQQAIDECARVLKGGGLMVLCFTCKESLQNRRFARGGLALYDPGDVQAMMASAGFAEIAIELLADRHRRFWCMTAVRVK
jgi:ubiquinone/menaquinone biosynthesis C-methylase UbiE